MTASVMSAVRGSNEISLSISHLFCIYFTSFAAEYIHVKETQNFILLSKAEVCNK